jgi:hypothetical protein
MTSGCRIMRARAAVLATTALLVSVPMTMSSQLRFAGRDRELVISQVQLGELATVSYDSTTRLNGDVWFRVGPFVAGQPLILEYRATSDTTVYASLASQPKTRKLSGSKVSATFEE